MADRQVLLADPLHSGLPAVIRSGPFLFLSSIDGDRDHRTGEYVHDRFGDGPAQAGAAYGAIVDRLTECGYDGRAVARVEHATSSQYWRLERMALWPQFFGTPTQAVSQGYQGKMAGQNMITVACVAAVPGTDRRVVTAGPSDQRAARVIDCGPFTFVIGVRGENSLATGAHSREESADAFAEQVGYSYDNIDFHLGAAGTPPEQLVRFDGFVRSVSQLAEHETLRSGHYSGGVAASCITVASPLGGRTDLEVSAIAARPGTDVTQFEVDANGQARAVRAGGFGFLSGAWGDRDSGAESEPSRWGRLDLQLDAALGQLDGSAALVGATLDDLVRLDVYAVDQHQWDLIDEWVLATFGDRAPVIVRHGVELGPTTLVGLSAVVAA